MMPISFDPLALADVAIIIFSTVWMFVVGYVLVGRFKQPLVIPARQLHRSLQRVIQISSVDVKVTLVFGILSLQTCFFYAPPSALRTSGILCSVALLVSGCISLRGNRLVRAGAARGFALLVKGQVIIIAAIALYCLLAAWLLERGAIDPVKTLTEIHPDFTEMILRQTGCSIEVLRGLVQRALASIYVTVTALTWAFNGGLCVFYARRKNVFASLFPPPLPQ